jgi:hypothetical protein
MLGSLKNVPLRSIWRNEAKDFTPWLAKSLDQLGQALGLELVFEGTEVPVGPYSADILAKDTGTDKYVVIENQLEKTNHDHLGKCITYASVLDASSVVWVAPKYTEEHKRAIEWLNDHTSAEVSFYAVVVELWQIDQSQPAVRFNVIVSPNEIVRQAIQRKDQGELTDTKKRQLEFWTKFRSALEKTGEVRSLQTARPQYWFDVTIGKSGIHLSNTFNTDRNEVGVRLYISNRHADSWLPFFLQNKEKVEQELKHPIEWNPNPDNRDKVILTNTLINTNSQTGIDEAIEWMVAETIAFKQVFGNLILEGNQRGL